MMTDSEFPLLQTQGDCMNVTRGQRRGYQCCAFCMSAQGLADCPQRVGDEKYCTFHQPCYGAIASYGPVKKDLKENPLFNDRLSPQEDRRTYAWRIGQTPPLFYDDLLKEAGWDESWEKPDGKDPWSKNAVSLWEARWRDVEWPLIKGRLERLQTDIRTYRNLRSQARQCFNTVPGCGDRVLGHDYFILRLQNWLNYIGGRLAAESRMKDVV